MFQSIYNVFTFRLKSVQRTDISLAFFQLSRMLGAGLTLSDALNGLASIDTSGRSQQVWRRVALSVSSGKSLSDAIDTTPVASDRLIVAILKAGEAGGQLDKACESVYRYLEWHITLRQRFYTLLIYPVFSLCVLVIVVGFLFISVVPSMKGFLLSSGSVLEWHTVALIGFSTLFSQYYMPALFLFFFSVLSACVVLGFSQRMRLIRDTWLLKIPLVGKLIIDLTLSRYSQSCAQLYANGVVLEASMELAEGMIGNRSLRSDLSNARIAMTLGSSLAEALSDVRNVPHLYARLVGVGESAGQLSEVLIQVGEHQSSAAEVTIKRMEQLVGPLLLLIVGAMLLWIVISVLGPVYNMAIATVVGVQ